MTHKQWLGFFKMCRNVNIWDEIITISQYILNIIFDTLCFKHIVIRLHYKRRKGKKSIVILYRCHQSGNRAVLIKYPMK